MMKTLVILLAMVNVAITQEINDDFWKTFKNRFNKGYETGEEEVTRHKIWRQNLNLVQQHNNEADRGMHSYRLGMNEYGDLTHTEFRRIKLGMRSRNESKETVLGSAHLRPNFMTVPQNIDWRYYGYVTPVQNQGNCGSCWAFSAAASLAGQHFRKTRKLVPLSAQNLVDCTKKYRNNGCDGGLMTNAFLYITMNGGIDTEQSYPYEAKFGRCRFKRSNIGATASGYANIKRGSEKDLKEAVASVGPVSAGIDSRDQKFQFYESGVYQSAKCSTVFINHAVLVVGYGTFQGKDYWLVKNTWGTSWGLDGYAMMARNKGNMCGIATLASYPLV